MQSNSRKSTLLFGRVLVTASLLGSMTGVTWANVGSSATYQSKAGDLSALCRMAKQNITLAATAAGIRLTVANLCSYGASDDDEEAGVVAAKKSTIAPITLPSGTYRFTGKKEIATLEEALKKLAGEDKGTFGPIEVLLWQDGAAAQKALPKLCKEAGYSYSLQSAIKSEEGEITPFVGEHKEKKGSLLGFWFKQGDNMLLIWAVVTPETREAADKDTTEPAPKAKPAQPSKPAAGAEGKKTPSTSGGKVPADLLGEWSWTTISGVNYVDTTTHQLASPSGMSARFTFTKDGRYKKFFYVRQRTYSLVTESTTTEEGTVTFSEDGFTMHPEKGYYKGNTGSRIIDRPMTAEERKVTTYRWEWRTENGKRQLYLGPSTSSLSRFKRAE